MSSLKIPFVLLHSVEYLMPAVLNEAYRALAWFF